MRNLFLTIILFLTVLNTNAQTVPTPGAPQSKPIVLLGGFAHLGNGNVIPNSVLAFENGKLTIVADATLIKMDFSKYEVIQLNGQHVYPGLISTGTDIGLTEVSAVRATNDTREVGGFNPNIKSLIAYNTDSQITPTTRSNGILIAQTVGGRGRILCSSSVVQLDAWNYEDAAVKEDDGIWVNWPYRIRFKGFWEGGGTEENKKYPEQMAALEAFFDDAKAYCNANKPEQTNLKFEAMRGVFDKTKNVYFTASDVKDIISCVEFAEKYDVKPVIFGGEESYMVADLLKEKNIPVIINGVNDLPTLEDKPITQAYILPKQLADAGILFTISVDDDHGDGRNMPFHLGTAVGYGLDKEKAIEAVTLSAAKILGIDANYGSIEEGKSATIIVSEGDVLDMRTSKIQLAFIDGRKVDLGNKQKDLYRKFMKKYGLEPEE